MDRKQRLTTVHDLLSEAFQVEVLRVEDESHLHAGHPGARSGKSHLAITLSSPDLSELTLLEQHRRVMVVIQHLFETELHAVRLVLNRE